MAVTVPLTQPDKLESTGLFSPAAVARSAYPDLRAAIYFEVFTSLPMLPGEGRAHHVGSLRATFG